MENKKHNNIMIQENWWSKKTYETNSFKVKTWGRFGLTILKVKQIHYRELKFLQSNLTINLLLPVVVIYWHDHMQTPNSWTLSLLDLHHKSTHACDYEIPLKGFRPRLVDLCRIRFHQHSIVDLVPVDACRVRRYRTF